MNVRGERIIDRERRYEVEGIRLSYLSSRIFGALAGIEPDADLAALLMRPHASYTLRTLVKYGLLDERRAPTPLGVRFAMSVRVPLELKPPSEERCNFGDTRLPLRFWAKATPEPNSGCWLWLGCLGTRGYGHFGANGKTLRAHRVAFIRLRREIPIELELDHKCRTACCCNPWHLEPVTHAENVRRGWLHVKDRHRPRGASGRFEAK